MNAALSMANKSQKELENLSAEADRAERERKNGSKSRKIMKC